MDRRRFLRNAGLVGVGAAVGGVASWGTGATAVDPDYVDALPRDAVADAAYANERWGDPSLHETKVIWRVETDEKLVALTFDDGPRPRNTSPVLDVLADRKVRATFNLVGARALEYPELVRREMAGRHQIENHTWSHKDFAFASRELCEFEIRRGADVVEQLTRRRPKFVRPPKGDVSGVALASAARAGADVLMWSLQLHEKLLDEGGNVRYMADNVTPGSILLAHDVGAPDRAVGLRALPGIIDAIRARGFEFVTVDELLEAGTVS